MSARQNYKRRGTTGAALSIGEFNIRSKSAYNTNNYGLSVDGTNRFIYLYLSGCTLFSFNT
jgi:hypothetical protein